MCVALLTVRHRDPQIVTLSYKFPQVRRSTLLPYVMALQSDTPYTGMGKDHRKWRHFKCLSSLPVWRWDDAMSLIGTASSGCFIAVLYRTLVIGVYLSKDRLPCSEHSYQVGTNDQRY